MQKNSSTVQSDLMFTRFYKLFQNNSAICSWRWIFVNLITELHYW